jgi:hypothetical protein
VASLRGYSEGTYLVNVHVYNKKPWKDSKMHRSNVKVQLIKLNPYEEITEATLIASRKGEEFTAFKFTLDDEGKVVEINKDKELLIGSKNVNSVYFGNGPENVQSDPVALEKWFGDWNTGFPPEAFGED